MGPSRHTSAAADRMARVMRVMWCMRDPRGVAVDGTEHTGPCRPGSRVYQWEKSGAYEYPAICDKFHCTGKTDVDNSYLRVRASTGC